MTMTLPFPDSDEAGSESSDLPASSLRSVLDVPFTDEQLDAITAPHAPAVVIAGAGSGKTSLMSARVVWLVANRTVPADAVLGLTFTNKAASELSSRVRSALRRLEQVDGYEGILDDGEPTISTYHAYAGSLLREYGVWAGFEPSAQLLTEAQRLQVAESVVREAPGPFPALGVKLKAVTERVVELEGEINEHLVDLADLLEHDNSLIAELDQVEQQHGPLKADPLKARETARARLELVGLVRAYRAEKHRLERIDFGDQMAAAATLAEQVPEVRRGERDRFDTVLLDEYQDTSMAQQRMLVALFGQGYPVMGVGDPFQSIYGWRGASIRNILSFQHDFAGSGPVPLFSLAQNNRSGGVILKAANVIAQPLRDQFPQVIELRPKPEWREFGELAVGMYRTSADEIEAVCDEIEREVGEGRAPHEIAVLCREAKTFPGVIAGLTERKVPVEVVGLSGLLEVPEVVEVVSVLEVLHDPAANPHLVRILAGPRWRIGPVDLALLGSRAQRLAAPTVASDARESIDAAGADGSALATERDLGTELQSAVSGSDPAEVVSLAEALEDPGPLNYSAAARERFAQVVAELRSLRDVLELPPDAAITTVISALGLDVELAVEGRPRDHLDALLEQARLFTASRGGTTVGPFLSYLHLAQRYGDTLGMAAPTGGGGVSLITVHRAKGLEWHSVYVPNVVEGSFPNTRSRSTPYSGAAVLPYVLRGDASDFPTVQSWTGNKGVQEFKRAVAERELAEDRRLAYVAVTRAAQRLVVTGHRWGPSQQRPRGASVYLQALYDECVAGLGSVLQWHPEPAEGETNPALEPVDGHPWPVSGAAATRERRQRAASMVRRAMGEKGSEATASLTASEAGLVAEWDHTMAALLAESLQRAETTPALPPLVSATAAVRLLRDPATARRRLIRPLPTPPAEAATRGTRFHQWVEARFGQVPLLDIEAPDGDDDLDSADLAALQEAFLAGPYADRQPAAVEAPFQLVLGQGTVAGRIDAVYRIEEDDHSDAPAGTLFEVVDWKTGQRPADVFQLAIYRLAWAELQGLPVEQVVASFYYVATGERERPDDLPDRALLTEWWASATA